MVHACTVCENCKLYFISFKWLVCSTSSNKLRWLSTGNYDPWEDVEAWIGAFFVKKTEVYFPSMDSDKNKCLCGILILISWSSLDCLA